MKPGTAQSRGVSSERSELTPLDALHAGAGFRLGARVGELRALGFVITCDKSEGFGRYTLIEAGQLEMRLAR